jgi:hypothetical protein
MDVHKVRVRNTREQSIKGARLLINTTDPPRRQYSGTVSKQITVKLNVKTDNKIHL